MSSSLTHQKYLVRTMLERGKITACEVTHISNANQYFCYLEKIGLSGSKWGKKGKARVKYRFILPHKLAKAKTFCGLA